jgi:hypothetical protein
MTRHEGAAMIRRLGKALGKALGPALRVALSGGLLSAGCAWAEVSRYCPAGGPIRFAHYEFGPSTASSSACPAASIPPSPPAPAEAAGPRGGRHLHEELGRRRRQRILLVRQDFVDAAAWPT